MITRTDLRRYRSITEELRQIDRLLRGKSGVSLYVMSVITGMPGTGDYYSRREAAGVQYEELSRRYEALQAELIQLQLHIEQAIADLEPLERTVIRCIYIEGRSIKQTGRRINYSPRSVDRILQRAYRKLA